MFVQKEQLNLDHYSGTYNVMTPPSGSSQEPLTESNLALSTEGRGAPMSVTRSLRTFARGETFFLGEGGSLSEESSVRSITTWFERIVRFAVEMVDLWGPSSVVCLVLRGLGEPLVGLAIKS